MGRGNSKLHALTKTMENMGGLFNIYPHDIDSKDLSDEQLALINKLAGLIAPEIKKTADEYWEKKMGEKNA